MAKVQKHNPDAQAAIQDALAKAEEKKASKAGEAATGEKKAKAEKPAPTPEEIAAKEAAEKAKEAEKAERAAKKAEEKAAKDKAAAAKKEQRAKEKTEREARLAELGKNYKGSMLALADKVKQGQYVKGTTGQLRSTNELAEALDGVQPTDVINIGLDLLKLEENPYYKLNVGQQSMNLRNRMRGAIKKGTLTLEDVKLYISRNGIHVITAEQIAEEAAAKAEAKQKREADAEAKKEAKEKADAELKAKRVAEGKDPETGKTAKVEQVHDSAA